MSNSKFNPNQNKIGYINANAYQNRSPNRTRNQYNGYRSYNHSHNYNNHHYYNQNRTYSNNKMAHQNSLLPNTSKNSAANSNVGSYSSAVVSGSTLSVTKNQTTTVPYNNNKLSQSTETSAMIKDANNNQSVEVAKENENAFKNTLRADIQKSIELIPEFCPGGQPTDKPVEANAVNNNNQAVKIETPQTHTTKFNTYNNYGGRGGSKSNRGGKRYDFPKYRFPSATPPNGTAINPIFPVQYGHWIYPTADIAQQYQSYQVCFEPGCQQHYHVPPAQAPYFQPTFCPNFLQPQQIPYNTEHDYPQYSLPPTPTSSDHSENVYSHHQQQQQQQTQSRNRSSSVPPKVEEPMQLNPEIMNINSTQQQYVPATMLTQYGDLSQVGPQYYWVPVNNEGAGLAPQGYIMDANQYNLALNSPTPMQIPYCIVPQTDLHYNIPYVNEQ